MRFWSLVLFVLLVCGCSTVPKTREPEVRSAPVKVASKAISPYSLCGESSPGVRLFEDHRAFRVGDILTVKVVENVTSKKTAETKTSKSSSASGGVSSFLGLSKKSLNKYSTYDLKTSSSFTGKGETNLSTNLVGTVTVQVVEVLPNGNLVVEGRRMVMINNDKTYLVIRGIVRPEDIDFDNTVYSTQVANAEIYYRGRGVVSDKQYPNVFLRFLDLVTRLWPIL